MKVIIEDASPRMLDELYTIEQQCFSEEAFSKQQIGYLLEDYNSISLAAKTDGKTAGFIIGRIDLVRNKPVGHVMTIDVLPRFRRRGIGRRLMQELESILRAKGAGEVRLEVREGNVAAIALYEKLGYAQVSRLSNYYGEAHGFFFRKVLR